MQPNVMYLHLKEQEATLRCLSAVEGAESISALTHLAKGSLPPLFFLTPPPQLSETSWAA